MDPSVVGGDQFGILWTSALPGNYKGFKEKALAQTLVYTPNTTQYLYISTNQNNIYKLNARTGEIVAQRNLHPFPFLASDVSPCNDVAPTIGTVSTGVIDPETNTWYLTAKTYLNDAEGPLGRLNGRYYIHAVSTDDLSERDNFPLEIEGLLARNNPNRMFQGGIHLQRPALVHTRDFFYAGFGSHCIQYNYTGWIIGWDKNGKIVEQFATQGGPESNTISGGGIWMSGGGISSDGKDLFFATGNGYTSQLHGSPVPGRNPPSSLEEAVVHMSVFDDGTLAPVDFFIPWEKEALDGADKDLGTSPFALLPSQFTCPNSKRLGVQPGKSGKIYFLNVDDLGGYCNGVNRLDRIPQVNQMENGFWAGAGVYPLEGGYVYALPVASPISAFKFSCDASGNSIFTIVAKTQEISGNGLGVGHGTTTSFYDQPGTGLLWVASPTGPHLRIYNAVPKDGALTLLKSFSLNGIYTEGIKFMKPVFGNGMAFLPSTGNIIAFGAPVNIPINCSVENFGEGFLVPYNDSNPIRTVVCQSKFRLNVTSLSSTSKNFRVISSLSFPFQLLGGENFTFDVKFNPIEPGPLVESLTITSNNHQTAGYSQSSSATLKGEGVSMNPLLSVFPITVTFNAVIFGDSVNPESFIIKNNGRTELQITSYDFSLIREGGATVSPNGTAVGSFEFDHLPTVVAPNSQEVIQINFNPPSTGRFQLYLTLKTNGGNSIINIFASSNTYPVALVEFQTPDESGWVKFVPGVPFSFGDVDKEKKLFLRVTNAGPPDAASLYITVSKPPLGGQPIVAANAIDLAEGTIIPVGQSATAALYCSPAIRQVNQPKIFTNAFWTMNNVDPSFGHQVIEFLCNQSTPQYGPLISEGEALYQYEGCFKDNNPDRQLPKLLYSSDQNNNSMCIWGCFQAGYKYAGTQYRIECWCGNTIPNQIVEESKCNYICAGAQEVCGGYGPVLSLFTRQTLPTTIPPTTTSIPPTTTSVPTTTTIIESITQAPSPKTDTLAPTTFGPTAETTGFDTTSTPSTHSPTTVEQTKLPTKTFTNAPTIDITSTTMTSDSMSSISVDTQAPTETTIPSSTQNEIQEHLTFIGCLSNAARDTIVGARWEYENMTLEDCATFCIENEVGPIAGVEYGTQCNCGRLKSGKIPTSSLCKMKCPGDPSQICGGPNAISTYNITSFVMPNYNPDIPSWTYSGCYQSTPGAVRVLPKLGYNGVKNSATYCTDSCKSLGFSVAGTEYAQECWCGDQSNLDVMIKASDPESNCNMKCQGDSKTICGGGGFISVYVYKPGLAQLSVSSSLSFLFWIQMLTIFIIITS